MTKGGRSAQKVITVSRRLPVGPETLVVLLCGEKNTFVEGYYGLGLPPVSIEHLLRSTQAILRGGYKTVRIVLGYDDVTKNATALTFFAQKLGLRVELLLCGEMLRQIPGLSPQNSTTALFFELPTSEPGRTLSHLTSPVKSLRLLTNAICVYQTSDTSEAGGGARGYWYSGSVSDLLHFGSSDLRETVQKQEEPVGHSDTLCVLPLKLRQALDFAPIQAGEAAAGESLLTGRGMVRLPVTPGMTSSVTTAQPPLPRSPCPALPLPCQECAAAAHCHLPGEELSAAQAVELLHPWVRLASNSYNSLVTETAPWGEAEGWEGCPALNLPPAVDAYRLHYVKDEARLVFSVSDSADFCEEQFVEIRDRLGQVYLDVSDKALLDDFGADTRKLRRWPGCEPCPRRGECPGCFVPTAEDVFERDERRSVHPWFAQLGGRIVDIGCGTLRYRGLLEPLLARPDTRYLAVEPTPTPELREYLTQHGARLLECGWEEAELAPGEADWVLIMRSWNHLRELGRALRRVREVLAPGGRVLVTENTAFGLVRTREQLARLERAASLPYEHYRNHTSAQARSWLEASGFGIKQEWAISADTANQWVLVAR